MTKQIHLKCGIKKVNRASCRMKGLFVCQFAQKKKANKFLKSINMIPTC